MKLTNIVKTIKQIKTETILLLQVGEFYYQYGKDAYIMAYIFGYKIKIIENNIPFSGFPKQALNKVISKLEDKEINYIIINKSLNYEVIEEQNFKNKNNYLKYYKISKDYITKRNRINEIYKKLMNSVNEKNLKEKLQKIEEILYEI